MRNWPSDRVVNGMLYGWICTPCAHEKKFKQKIKTLTYHLGECGWCGADMPVSNSEDWTKKSKGRTKSADKIQRALK